MEGSEVIEIFTNQSNYVDRKNIFEVVIGSPSSASDPVCLEDSDQNCEETLFVDRVLIGGAESTSGANEMVWESSECHSSVCATSGVLADKININSEANKSSTCCNNVYSSDRIFNFNFSPTVIKPNEVKVETAVISKIKIPCPTFTMGQNEICTTDAMDGIVEYLTPEKETGSNCDPLTSTAKNGSRKIKKDGRKRKQLPITSSVSPKRHRSNSFSSFFLSDQSSNDNVNINKHSPDATTGRTETSTPRERRLKSLTLPPLTPIISSESIHKLNNSEVFENSVGSSCRRKMSRRKSEDQPMSKLCPKGIQYENSDGSISKKSYIIKPEGIQNDSTCDDSFMVNKERKVSRKINFSQDSYPKVFDSTNEDGESMELLQLSVLSQDECDLVCSVGWHFKDRIRKFLSERFKSLIPNNEERRKQNAKMYVELFVKKIENLLSILLQQVDRTKRNFDELVIMAENIFHLITVDVNKRIWIYVDNQWSFDDSVIMKSGLDWLEPSHPIYNEENLYSLFNISPLKKFNS